MTASIRLGAIADMVPACNIVADIGCDHGKVAAALVQSGKAQRAICGDISAGSLGKARKLVCESGLEDRVSLREGSGFSVLTAGEADVAVVAGMGGLLISRILAEGAEAAPDMLVLSPNRDAALLRRQLVAQGFYIADEALVYETRHFYPVIRAQRGTSRAFTDIELEFGPVLLEKKPEILKQFVQRRIQETQAICGRLERSGSPGKQQLLEGIKGQVKKYTEVEKCL
jgi:tRNA (adenine22-N1)-methyltransferase